MKLLDSIRNAVRAVVMQIARFLHKVSGGHITPNMVTLVGLLAHIPIAWLIAQQYFGWSAVLLTVFGLFDTLDGALARLQHRESKKGMFYDSVTDRIKELLVYIGISYSFIYSPEPGYALWALTACGLSIIISYLNAWGEVVTADLPKETDKKNSIFRNGLATYDVRIFLLIVGLLFNQLQFVLPLLVFLALTTIWQRFTNVTKRL